MFNDKPNDWYRTFFHGVALDFWRAYATPELTRGEADFLESVLDLNSGARLLDVPCGNGRHSLEMSRRGYQVTGLDFSSENIREARDEARKQGCEAEWLEADMLDLDRKEEFDAVFCLGNSFGYMSEPGMQRFLKAVARALKPGGRFLLETGVAAESLLPSVEERTWYEAAGMLILIESQYEANESRLDTKFTFIRDGQSEVRVASHWVYTAGRIRSLHQEAGLQPEASYGGTDRSPYRLRSRVLYLVSRK